MTNSCGVIQFLICAVLITSAWEPLLANLGVWVEAVRYTFTALYKRFSRMHGAAAFVIPP